MPASLSPSAWAQDLPVCFPDRPCLYYPPLEADAINLTSDLTPASQAIATGCLVVLGVAMVLSVLGLATRSPKGPSLWLVGLSTALVVIGVVAAGAVDLRFSAITAVYGRDGPGGPELFASWSVVGLAGEAMAVAGTAGLAVTATVAIVWLRGVLPRS